jgi:hypothetical protein
VAPYLLHVRSVTSCSQVKQPRYNTVDGAVQNPSHFINKQTARRAVLFYLNMNKQEKEDLNKILFTN